MTPAAKLLIEEVAQAIKARWTSPQYGMLMRAVTINPDDAGMPYVVYWRDMMLLGSVLLPAAPAPEPTPDDPDPVAPPFYLDDPFVRTIIRRELRLPLRQFVREAHVASWDALIETPGGHRGSTALVRRFYTTDQAGDFGWAPALVPTQAEKDAEGSTVPADATVMPDLEAVTDLMRYSALGL